MLAASPTAESLKLQIQSFAPDTFHWPATHAFIISANCVHVKCISISLFIQAYLCVSVISGDSSLDGTESMEEDKAMITDGIPSDKLLHLDIIDANQNKGRRTMCSSGNSNPL